MKQQQMSEPTDNASPRPTLGATVPSPTRAARRASATPPAATPATPAATPPAATPLQPSATPADLRALFAHANIGMSLTDLHNQYVQVNAAYCALTGYTEAELIALNFSAIIHPDDEAANRAHIDAMLAGDIPSFIIEKRFLRKDGSLVWVHGSISLLYDSQGAPTHILALLEDITLRKQLEAERETLLTYEQNARHAAESAQAQLSAILDVLPMGVIVADAQGKLLQVNHAFHALWGEHTLAADIANYTIYQGWRPDGSPMRPADWALARALEHGDTVRNQEVTIQSFDGQRKTILNNAVPLRDPNGAIIGGAVAFIDITEHKQLSLARAEQDAQLAAVFEAITDGVYVYDRDRRLIQTNAAAQRINPFIAQPDYLARPLAERIAPFSIADQDGSALPFDTLPLSRVLNGETLSGMDMIDTAMRFNDGHTILLNTTGAPIRDANGAVAGAVIVTRDVTERRRLERRTRESLDALLAMAEALVRLPTTPTTSPATDQSDSHALAQRLLELTRGMLGCERASIIGIHPHTGVLQPIAVIGLPPAEAQWWHAEMPHHTISEYLSPALLARLRAGEVALNEAPQTLRDDAPPLPAHSVLIAPLRIANTLLGILSYDYGHVPHTYHPDELALAGAVSQLAALALERDRLLREREQAHAETLALQETKRQMDTFLGIVSHELRTPLTSAKANIQLASRQMQRILSSTEQAQALLPLLERQHSLLERSERQMDRQDRLISDLLDVSRIQTGKLELRLAPTDLNLLVTESIDEQRLIHPTRAITFTTSGPASPILADADRIAQVITNYLTNALKYAPDHTPIHVEATYDGAHAQVRVRDSGPGLPLDEQSRIWDRFHRVAGIEVLSGSGIGLGLGLYISREIIERHGGQVGVESAPGHGATFWFTLPLPLASA